MKLSEILKRMFVERVCLICTEAVSYDKNPPICPDCEEDWQAFLSIKCRECGREYNECTCLPSKIRKICHSMASWCYFYDVEKNGNVGKIFYNLKYNYDRATINFCANMMKRSLDILFRKRDQCYNDYVVTYIPRRYKNVKKYGFDQSQKLAKALARLLKINCICTLDNVGNAEQKHLNKKERAYNAQMSFKYIEGSLKDYKKVILVDDIMTSGATLFTCALQLYKNGATAVVPATFAKDNYVIKGGRRNVKRSTKYNFAGAVKGFVRNGS